MRLIFSVFGLTTLASCGIIPDYQSPEPTIDTPSVWSSATNVSTTKPQPWMEEFNDPQLNNLIDEALLHNYDLKAAFARVSAAKAFSLAFRT